MSVVMMTEVPGADTGMADQVRQAGVAQLGDMSAAGLDRVFDVARRLSSGGTHADGVRGGRAFFRFTRRIIIHG
jgi:hypothetical protein